MTKKQPSRNSNKIGLIPKKNLGQNFLQDDLTVQKITQAIFGYFTETEPVRIHEVGPGTGALTSPLLQRGAHVLAIEKDPRAVVNLQTHVQPSYPQHLQIIETSILDWSPPAALEKPLCAGNIPYYISSPILLWLCQHRDIYRGAVLMVQKELAERLVAPPHTKDYGRLSVRLQLSFQMKIHCIVPASCFYPAPKVDSAVVCFWPQPRSPFVSSEEEAEFEKFTAHLFSQRRKMIGKTIQSWSAGRTRLTQEGAAFLQTKAHLRPEALNPEEILGLFRLLQGKKA